MTEQEYRNERLAMNRQARLQLIAARGIKVGSLVRWVGQPPLPEFPNGRPVVRITAGGNIVCQHSTRLPDHEVGGFDPIDLIVIG